MREELLRLNNISVHLNGHRLLNGISFSAFSGEILAVCGLRFTGKSVLARLLTEEYCPYDGDIIYPAIADEKSTSQYVHYISDGCFSFGSLSIADVFFGVRKPKHRQIFYRKLAAQIQTQEILRTLDISLPSDAPASALRVAESHRLHLEKAVTLGAKIVILDSITNGYTQREYQLLLKVMRMHPEVCFLYLTNGEDAIVREADRIMVIRNGCPAGMLYHNQFDRTSFETMLKGNVNIQPSKHSSHIREEREIGQLHIGENCIKLRAGKIIGLYDENGGAAERLVKKITSNPSQVLWLCGSSPCSYSQAVRQGLGVISRDYAENAYFHRLSTCDNLSFQVYQKISRFCFLPKHLMNYIEKNVLEEYGLNDQTGILEKILLRWAISRPTLLVLENVLTGLNPQAYENVYHILDRISSEGTAILFISADLRDLSPICGSILPIYETI